MTLGTSPASPIIFLVLARRHQRGEVTKDLRDVPEPRRVVANEIGAAQ